MSFPRYPKYKGSGVEWLGDVPKDWELPKIKHVAHIVGGGTPSRENPAYWNGTIPWVSPKDMKSERISDSEECITELGLQSSSTCLIPTGRVLMVIRSGILQHTLPVAINDASVALNQDLKAFTFDERVCASQCFQRWVQGLNDRLLLAWASEGATVESINQTLLRDSILPVPNITEQTAIVAFLDRETGKIEELVAEQRRLIELLKEKRQAVISHAVTKGLNPQAPTKPSGIEWLGDVPKHSEVATVRHITKEHKQGYYTKDTYVDDGTPLLRITDIRDDTTIDFSGCPSLPVTDDQSQFGLSVGDFVFVRSGASIGKFGIVEHKTDAIFGSYTIRFSFQPKLKRDFLKWYFQSCAFLEGLFSKLHGGAIKNVNAENIKDQLIVIPPEEEQQQIAGHLEDFAAKTFVLEEEAERAIELLQERRTALISAAVTGKIDVREFACQVTA